MRADLIERLRGRAYASEQECRVDDADVMTEAADALAAQEPVVAAKAEEGWRPIDGDNLAPKDGTVVDLWLLNRKTRTGRREPDCHFSKGTAYPYWLSHDGKWINGKRYMDGDGDWSIDPGCTDEDSIVATHWRFPPAAPTRKGEGQP